MQYSQVPAEDGFVQSLPQRASRPRLMCCLVAALALGFMCGIVAASLVGVNVRSGGALAHQLFDTNSTSRVSTQPANAVHNPSTASPTLTPPATLSASAYATQAVAPPAPSNRPAADESPSELMPSLQEVDQQRMAGTEDEDAKWAEFLSTAELHPKMDYTRLGEYRFPQEQLLPELEGLMPQQLDFDTMAVQVSADDSVDHARAVFAKTNLAWSENMTVADSWQHDWAQQRWSKKVQTIVRLQDLEARERQQDLRPPVQTLVVGANKMFGFRGLYPREWMYSDTARGLVHVFNHSNYDKLDDNMWNQQSVSMSDHMVIAYPYLALFRSWGADFTWMDSSHSHLIDEAVWLYDVVIHIDFEDDGGNIEMLPEKLVQGTRKGGPIVLHMPDEPHKNLRRCANRRSPLPPNCPVVVDLYGCMQAITSARSLNPRILAPSLLQTTTMWYHYPVKQLYKQFYVPFYTKSVFIMARRDYAPFIPELQQFFGSLGFEVKGPEFPAFGGQASYMHGIAKCKYLVIPPIPRPSLGQLVAEGAILGVPTFAPVLRLFPRLLMHPYLVYQTRDLHDIFPRVEFLESNPHAYEQVRAFQARRTRLIDTQYMPSVRQMLARVQSTIHNTTRDPLNPAGDRYDLCQANS